MVLDMATPVPHFSTAQKIAHRDMPYTLSHKQLSQHSIANIQPGSTDSINSVKKHTQSHPDLATMHVTVCEDTCSFCKQTPEAVSHPNKFTPAALT